MNTDTDTAAQLAALRAAIRGILMEDDGQHWRTGLSGADVIQELSTIAEQHGCVTVCPTCQGNGCDDAATD